MKGVQLGETTNELSIPAFGCPVSDHKARLTRWVLHVPLYVAFFPPAHLLGPSSGLLSRKPSLKLTCPAPRLLHTPSYQAPGPVSLGLDCRMHWPESPTRWPHRHRAWRGGQATQCPVQCGAAETAQGSANSLLAWKCPSARAALAGGSGSSQGSWDAAPSMRTTLRVDCLTGG